MTVIDRIKYDGPSNGTPWLIYKYPGEQFVLGSQLIVNQGQEALFFKGGEALDLFRGGTYTLKTGNLPLLSRIVNFPFGGETPFSAEIYFINMTSRLDMTWGTAEPFQLEDPKYGKILSIRSHGRYGLRIIDARMFVNELVGAVLHGTTITHQFVAKYFSGLIATVTKSAISDYMIKQKISFLEITVYLKALSEICKNEISREFERYGVEIQNFYVEYISPPKCEIEELKKYKESLMTRNCSSVRRDSYGNSFVNNRNVEGTTGAESHPGKESATTQNTGRMICPRCSAVLESGMKFCGNCGEKISRSIICPRCGTQNDENMKFCVQCGAKLVKKCTACGVENSMQQNYCGNCGNSL